MPTLGPGLTDPKRQKSLAPVTDDVDADGPMNLVTQDDVKALAVIAANGATDSDLGDDDLGVAEQYPEQTKAELARLAALKAKAKKEGRPPPPTRPRKPRYIDMSPEDQKAVNGECQ